MVATSSGSKGPEQQEAPADAGELVVSAEVGADAAGGNGDSEAVDQEAIDDGTAALLSEAASNE